jgi:hypothetical protein
MTLPIMTHKIGQNIVFLALGHFVCVYVVLLYVSYNLMEVTHHGDSEEKLISKLIFPDT